MIWYLLSILIFGLLLSSLTEIHMLLFTKRLFVTGLWNVLLMLLCFVWKVWYWTTSFVTTTPWKNANSSLPIRLIGSIDFWTYKEGHYKLEKSSFIVFHRRKFTNLHFIHKHLMTQRNSTTNLTTTKRRNQNPTRIENLSSLNNVTHIRRPILSLIPSTDSFWRRWWSIDQRGYCSQVLYRITKTNSK